MNSIPYLAPYVSVGDMKQASLAWFRNATFGMFIHYGLYSLLGRGEWVQYHEKIPVTEYAKLKDDFTAEKFDADAFVDLAVDAGMKYINITTRHHDSFCLFDTKTTDFKSTNSPAKRDLVYELANACARKNIGLFCYVSYGADWRHPYFHSREHGSVAARPDYPSAQPEYLYREKKDFRRYMDYVHAQIGELLTKYGPIAGIWLDLIMDYYFAHELYPIEETYALVRKLQPQTLISFKQGATGMEDFAAPERQGASLAERLEKMNAPASSVEVARNAWGKNKDKWNEICSTLQMHKWGYAKDEPHRDADFVMAMLGNARAHNSNLIMNTGPLPDGSIHEGDAAVLREAGRRIRENGFPPALVYNEEEARSSGAAAGA
ncbi:MAG: alpha-L-fucosidase [Spirochaetota bacterium]